MSYQPDISTFLDFYAPKIIFNGLFFSSNLVYFAKNRAHWQRKTRVTIPFLVSYKMLRCSPYVYNPIQPLKWVYNCSTPKSRLHLAFSFRHPPPEKETLSGTNPETEFRPSAVGTAWQGP